MGIVSLLGLIVALVLIGIGIVFGLLAAVLLIGLVATGVVSSSVAIGFWSGKPQTAVRALLLQIGLLTGIPAGIAGAWLLSTVAEWLQAATPAVVVVGAVGGALAGVVVALLVDTIGRRTGQWVALRFARREENPAIDVKR
jgi:hypothetical protein